MTFVLAFRLGRLSAKREGTKLDRIISCGDIGKYSIFDADKYIIIASPHPPTEVYSARGAEGKPDRAPAPRTARFGVIVPVGHLAALASVYGAKICYSKCAKNKALRRRGKYQDNQIPRMMKNILPP